MKFTLTLIFLLLQQKNDIKFKIFLFLFEIGIGIQSNVSDKWSNHFYSFVVCILKVKAKLISKGAARTAI